MMVESDILEGTTPMTTETRHATRRVGEPAAWWKAWILLSSLGATVVGWMALPGVEPPADAVVVSPRVTAMPQKPAFEAPVTRTRSS